MDMSILLNFFERVAQLQSNLAKEFNQLFCGKSDINRTRAQTQFLFIDEINNIGTGELLNNITSYLQSWSSDIIASLNFTTAMERVFGLVTSLIK